LNSPPLNRMVVATLALIGVFVSIYMLLYKLGAFGTIACGASSDCAVVQASPYAYFLGIPVAAWGVVGYLAIFGLALAGTRPGFGTDRRIAAGILALTGGAFLFSLYLSFLEEFVIGAWCRWCIASALLATLAFLFTLPEIRRIRRGRAGAGPARAVETEPAPPHSFSASSRTRFQSSID
jgi:uncharacterized membrane protein